MYNFHEPFTEPINNTFIHLGFIFIHYLTSNEKMKLYSPVTLVIKIAMYLHPRAQKLCLRIFNNITLVYKKDEFMLDRVTFDTVG